jgi:type IV secretory pathway VirJ component
MKRFVVFFLLWTCFCLRASSIEIDSVYHQKFGKVIVYHPVGTPSSVALFVSGDGGWRHGVLNMAKHIANQGALVLGIDAKHYSKYLSKVKDNCLYPAADFEELSIDIQKKYKLPTYHKPVLIGYSYGAVFVYGIIAQARAHTFQGAIALGFCPDIDLKNPLCKGNGLTQHILKPGKSYFLEAAKNLSAPFIVLNGVKDKTCPFEATELYLKNMPVTELVKLPKVGHGFSIADNWPPQFSAAYKKIVNYSPMRTKVIKNNLPITLVSTPKKSNLPLILMISGDGGWTSFDQSLAQELAEKGLPVIGLDAQKYFWNAKTPESSAAEINNAILEAQQKLGKQQLILTGYSFGASIIPFIANRLTTDLKTKLRAVVLLSPQDMADFEIHVTDMLNIGHKKGRYDVIAEIKKIKEVKPVCVFGREEPTDKKAIFTKNGIRVINSPGNHHYNEDYGGIANIIKQQAR